MHKRTILKLPTKHVGFWSPELLKHRMPKSPWLIGGLSKKPPDAVEKRANSSVAWGSTSPKGTTWHKYVDLLKETPHKIPEFWLTLERFCHRKNKQRLASQFQVLRVGVPAWTWKKTFAQRQDLLGSIDIVWYRSAGQYLLSKWVISYNPSYKWTNPTYPIYNQGYNPLTKWDEPPSRIGWQEEKTQSFVVFTCCAPRCLPEFVPSWRPRIHGNPWLIFIRGIPHFRLGFQVKMGAPPQFSSTQGLPLIRG